MSHPVGDDQLHRLLEVASVPLEMARPHMKIAIRQDPWTTTSLPSALLELVIAFLFLARATISYFTSKFVRVFDLHPPCFDRDGTTYGQRSDLQNRCPHRDRRLYALRHCVLRKSFIQHDSSSERGSLSSSCSEHDTSLKLIKPNQFYFTCRRQHPLRADQGVHSACSHHPYLDAKRTRNFVKSAALKGLLWCENDASPWERKYHRLGKRMSTSLSLEGPPDTCGISDDDCIADGHVGGSQLEREHSLKVFPEEFIDFYALSQEHEQKGVPQDHAYLDTRHLTFEAESAQASESAVQQSLDELEEARYESENSNDSGAQVSGYTPESLTESLFDKVIDVSELHTMVEQSEPAEDPGKKIETCTSARHQHTRLLVNSALVESSITVGGEEAQGPGNENDDDPIQLKKRIVAERAVLNRTYLELERERIASISAAGEAMATITRLQKDKAALQMEGLHYQRIAEEKALFDEEAILVLRDSLLKREVEKLALEKEIEIYKRKLLKGRSEAAEKENEQDRITNAFLWESSPLSELEGSKVNGHEEEGQAVNGVKEVCEKENPEVAYFSIDNRTGLARPMVALTLDASEREKKMARKPRHAADKQRQQVLQRMSNLEKQILRLKAKHDPNVEVPLAAVSGQVDTSDRFTERSLKESRKISECEINQYDYSPDRGIPGGTRTEGNIESSIETKNWVAMPNPYLRGELRQHEAKLPIEEELSTTCLSLSFHLNQETLLADEERRAVGDDANEGSRHTSPKVSYSDFWIRTSISRERSMKEDMQKLRCRLQVLEADTELISETIESMRRETTEMERLQEVAQKLKLLRRAGESKLRGRETSHDVFHAIEAVKSPPRKRQCFCDTLQNDHPVLLSDETTCSEDAHVALDAC